jgi:hypothetical protein
MAIQLQNTIRITFCLRKSTKTSGRPRSAAAPSAPGCKPPPDVSTGAVFTARIGLPESDGEKAKKDFRLAPDSENEVAIALPSPAPGPD